MQVYINRYIDEINSVNSGLSMWRECYDCFGAESDSETLSKSLHLYLAAYGMLRGSSTLSRKSYRVHLGIVKKLQSKTTHLRNISITELGEKAGEIIEIKDWVEKYYSKKFGEGKTATDTLSSKIIMGVSGCTPAFDIYVKKSLEKLGLIASFSERSLEGICKYFSRTENVQALNRLREGIGGPLVGDIRIIDAYLFEFGKELDGEKKEKDEQNAKNIKSLGSLVAEVQTPFIPPTFKFGRMC